MPAKFVRAVQWEKAANSRQRKCLLMAMDGRVPLRGAISAIRC